MERAKIMLSEQVKQGVKLSDQELCGLVHVNVKEAISQFQYGIEAQRCLPKDHQLT